MEKVENGNPSVTPDTDINEPDQSTKISENLSSVTPTFKSILVNPNYYLVAIGFSCYILRRTTYVAWLASGWPEWVAMEGDPDEYNQEINRFQSIVTFPFIFVNIITGLWLDFCRRWWRDRSDTYGEMIGLTTSFIGSAIGMVVSSVLQAQQVEAVGYAVVITHNIARSFGVLWGPLYFYLFPSQLYGFVFGSLEVLSQMFSLLNLALLSYNTKNDDYSLMNYVLAGIASLISLVAIATYRRFKVIQTTTEPTNEAYEHSTSL